MSSQQDQIYDSLWTSPSTLSDFMPPRPPTASKLLLLSIR